MIFDRHLKGRLPLSFDFAHLPINLDLELLLTDKAFLLDIWMADIPHAHTRANAVAKSATGSVSYDLAVHENWLIAPWHDAGIFDDKCAQSLGQSFFFLLQ